MSTESLFFVGTYTTRGSLGIYTVTLDVDSGKMEEIFVDKSVSDPSFLKLNPKMNRLYGVTMPEKGVSQLVAVDLQKAEELVA